MDGTEIQPFTDNRFTHDSLLSLSVDSQGDIWVSSIQSPARLYHISHGNLIHMLISPLIAFGQGMDDGNGRMLFQTWGGIASFSRADPSLATMSIIDEKRGLKDFAVNPGIVDREGNLWLYGGNSGLTVLTERNIVHVPMNVKSYPMNNKVAATDSQGHIWVATGAELLEVWKTDKGTWETYSHIEVNSSIGKFPSAVMFGSDSALYSKSWESDFGKFRVRYNKGSNSTLQLERVMRRGIDFPDVGLVCFFIDSKNRVWCSLQEVGITVFDLAKSPTQIKLYQDKNSLPGKSVRSIYEDLEGKIWLDRNTETLTKITHPMTADEKLKRFTQKDGLHDERIRSLCQLRDGSMLIGSRYNGLARMNDNEFTILSVKEGLASNAVWCMATDSSGTVLLGTDNGAQILTTKNIFNIGKTIYTKGEHILSCGIENNGFAWVVSSTGLTIIEGFRDTLKPVIPPVYIQSVLVNNISVDVRKPLELSYNQNHLDIDFTGIYFKDPSTVRYDYRLLNEETTWSQPISHSRITYAQLVPGTYTFEVRAITGEGVRSTLPATFSFTIASPFWKTWWFIFSGNIVVLGLIWLGYKYRTNQLLRIERLRTRISADLHDEIASNLSSIAMFSKIIEEENRIATTVQPLHQSLLNRISILSQESVQSIRDIIWAIDPKTETLESLLNRLRDSASILCRAKNIQLNFQLQKEGELPTDDLAPEVRKNLWLIAKEAMNNAISHSHCNNIRFSYKLESSMFVLNIEDDGEGINEKKSSKGKGLATMRMRAKQLNGKLEIGRNEKGGTSIVATVNLK
ncbi:MAG: hypothetical protein HYZ34_00555 [Ignavibacteriae bacterium]|nr:hypothetical protein [Ignavibacteriota bacterium]